MCRTKRVAFGVVVCVALSFLWIGMAFASIPRIPRCKHPYSGPDSFTCACNAEHACDTAACFGINLGVVHNASCPMDFQPDCCTPAPGSQNVTIMVSFYAYGCSNPNPCTDSTCKCNWTIDDQQVPQPVVKADCWTSATGP